MNYKEYRDIHDFYQKTGMNREQAFEFLLSELKKQELEHEPRGSNPISK